MALKLLKVERLDTSDDFVFERPAAKGEIAVSGAFHFWGDDPGTLAGKRRQAFRTGFLGLTSFGRATLAVASGVTDAERAAAVERLAIHLVDRCGAPDLPTARRAAEEEIAFSENLADLPEGTVVALARTVEDGAIAERFRTLHRAEPKQDFSRGLFNAIVAVPDDETEDDVDLAALARTPNGPRGRSDP
ncbi:DUF6505 family protein [Chthonobacter rhizosphaerae]|uniref:DUF6505 family protein n=1 Tax=Chthonobacter rhizosphaerae TaxID=2735553 RepID=UPI0015EFB736|nr:DUF6505 family protein [Chthonobacter rhizosphaerae]